MTRLALGAAWRARLAARQDTPPRRPREALHWRGERIGSVEPDLFERAGMLHLVARDAAGWHMHEPAAIADGLRAAGLAGAWRDEQLAVRNGAGAVLGTIERGAARALGIATVAVHLLAVDERGHHWVQQRAWTKDTDPGMWDTLVGGMVPAGEPLLEALERETWEEAGLRLAELRDLRHGGMVRSVGPSSSVPHGYVIEDVEWFTCTLPAGVLPSNQDGEVAGFECLAPAALAARLEQDGFTHDASVLYATAFALPD